MARVRNLVLVVIVAFVSHSRGLEFSLSKTSNGQFCGQLKCLINTDQNDQSIFSIVGMTIYDVTKATTKEKVASITVSVSSDQELHVEPSKSDSVNASGSISRYHADLTLDLRRTTDCLNSSFLCELDFMNTAGQLDSQEKTVAPTSTDCSADLSQIASDLSLRAAQLEDQLAKLGSKYKDLEAKLDTILSGHCDNTATNSPPTGGHETTQTSPPTNGIQTTQTTTQKHTPSPETSGPTTRKACAPGMTLDHSREKFDLQGFSIQALCDTETDGGAWVIIQRRTKGDVDFYKGWADYKNGFGTPDSDFWIGNEVIHKLTSQGYTELRIDMEYQGSTAFAHYSSFSVGDEDSNYKLTVSGYSGTAGDDFSYHSGLGFTTFDRDNDEAGYNCAEDYHGAWWYKDCYQSNLNGEWGTETGNAMIWNQFILGKALTVSEMKIRHI